MFVNFENQKYRNFGQNVRKVYFWNLIMFFGKVFSWLVLDRVDVRSGFCEFGGSGVSLNVSFK
jgi:hypothetical protein